jgi:UDP-N-acetylglucosamine 2-epimerase
MQLLISYGTRPEYIKIKPILDVLTEEGIEYLTLFTGQHQDLLKEHTPTKTLNIKSEELNKNRLDNIVSSILSDNVFDFNGIRPSHVMVMGDTTSAMAVALSAFHNGIKVIHLEAGLRTYDNENPYPEEANRRIISAISDINLCPTDHTRLNLINENFTKNIFVVGNTVIDNLLPYKDKCAYTDKILITLHRRENHHWLDKWFVEIDKLAEENPQFDFVLPIHPNPNVQKHKHLLKHVNVIDPLPYEDMLELLVKTRLVITDSGGLQEECSFFNKKCLTCRIVTERPEAIGTSTFMVKSPDALSDVFNEHIDNYVINYKSPFGDGYAAIKIIAILKNII